MKPRENFNLKEGNVLKHKFCKETKSKAKLLHLFVFLVMNVELLQVQ